MRRRISLAILCLLPSASSACLWDYDTLKQERSRFPDTLEIITGKFLRHSPEFYEWRIKDRLEKLKRDPKNAAYHDDLAVAYAKTGQYAKAIATMEALEKIVPGRYETYSNLSTFHFLAGDIEKALPIIDKALAINPDAHFGREKYQRWLGEYLLANPTRKLPISSGGGFALPHRPNSFAVFLRSKLEKKELDLADLQPAIKGVLGMMRFANHESPILLEALGDLLWLNSYVGETTGKRLAARAYLKASQRISDPDSRAGYRQLASDCLMLQSRDGVSQEQLTLQEVEFSFEQELRDAEQWYADLKAKEVGWIGSGADPETEFDKLYVEEPRVPDEPTVAFPRTWAQRNWYALLLVMGIGVAALVGCAGVFVARRLMRRPTRTA